MAYNKASQVLSSPATQDKLGNVGETLLINLHPGKDMKNLHNLGVARLQMMRRIINTFPNLNVLYTDTDAIWLKDPAQLYHHPQHQSSNIVASRGTYPQHCPIAGEANGDPATIWFGFTYFRNSPDLRQLVLNVENDIGKYQYDDQHAINCVLSNLYNSNNLVSMYYEFHTSVITLEDGSLVRSFRRSQNDGVVHNIKVSLLPYHKVQRHCDDMTKVTSLVTSLKTSLRKLVDSRVDGGRKVATNLKDVVVAHCYAEEKEGNSKMASFERYGFLVEGENSLWHSFSEPALEEVQLEQSDDQDPSLSAEEAAYTLAEDRFWRRINAAKKNYYPDLKTQYESTKAITGKTRLLNIIRIPEAGSSALSVTARALAGCSGCTGSQPDYDGNEAVITSLRDPVSRSLSTFFYAPPHTSVKQGETHTWDEFVGNVQSPRNRNVLTKMLNGAYAYDNFDESKHTVESAKARLCSVAWFALSEMPISSSVMLYETPDFRQLLPNPVTFGLPAQDAVQEEVNSDSEHEEFLATSFTKNNVGSFVIANNQQDVEVYLFGKILFCARLLSNPGLVAEMRLANLGNDEIEHCANLGPAVGDVLGECRMLAPRQ